MTAPTAPSAQAGATVYRHSIWARTGHWLWTLALVVLVTSGLEIFNAAPYLDASDASDPHHRVLAFTASDQTGKPIGYTVIAGHAIPTTHVFGYGADGAGGEAPRAFPAWLTFPGYQDLADGRRWHLLFGWALVAAMAVYALGQIVNGKIRELLLRPSDLPKLWPMQAYYLRLRPDPPPHGAYNPLQKAGYTTILLIVFPAVIVTGLALSPGVDAQLPFLTPLLGGRQFARTWHFLAMLVLVGFTFGHLALVASTGLLNNLRGIVTGWYRLGEHDGVGP